MGINQESITSLFDYYESKSAEMQRMSVETGIISTGRDEDWNPEEETAEDWKKIQNGKTMKRTAFERGITYLSLIRRLKQFGYK